LSSILKALKKLENEHARSGDQIALPQKLGTKRNISRWEITSGRFSTLLWVVLAGVVITVVAGVIIYVRQPAGPETVTAAAPVTPARTAVKKIQRQTPLVSAREPVRVRKPNNRPTPSSVPPVPSAGGASGPPVQTSAEKSKKRPPPPVPVRRTAVKPKVSPEVNLPILSSELTLQAISWSVDPKSRIAVINSNVIREGGLVAGYSITRIDKNQVLVRKGADTWKLLFKLK